MANLNELYDIDNRHIAFENHRSGLLVSIAGPGTGKTFSFLRRIDDLVNCQNINPNSICYLTFIKEIANAFISDYEDEFGIDVDELSLPRISTLHSFACRIIRNRGFSIGYDGHLFFGSIADRNLDSSNVFIGDLLPCAQTGSIRTVARLRRVLEAIKDAWRDGIDPAGLQDPIPGTLQTCINLSRAYRLIDWDQAIPIAHDLYLDPYNRQSWINELHHYLVDEYQDFNRAEQEFISTVASNISSMVVVGDDDQSIYSRRGGSPAGLRSLFDSEHVDTITMEISRRCKSNILDVANTFLSSMRRDPHLMSPFENGGDIRCYRFKSTKAEIIYLIRFLQACIARLPENPRPKDGIVCLFPSWKSLNFYLGRIGQEVPCQTRKPQTNQLRLCMTRYMELVCRPRQRFVERLILEDFDDIKPRHKRALIERILEEDISPVDGVNAFLGEGVFSGQSEEAAMRYCDFCDSLSSQDPVSISESLSAYSPLDAASIRAHLEWFFEHIDLIDQDENISRFCDSVLPETALPFEDPRSVLFLTFHGSKGLTKHAVVMPGLEDAWLPGGYRGEEYEECKRLFYVGITRATDIVLFTYPRTRARNDPMNYATPGRGDPCRFIADGGINCQYNE